jgi:hypothetical protein
MEGFIGNDIIFIKVNWFGNSKGEGPIYYYGRSLFLGKCIEALKEEEPIF